MQPLAGCSTIKQLSRAAWVHQNQRAISGNIKYWLVQARGLAEINKCSYGGYCQTCLNTITSVLIIRHEYDIVY